MKKCDLYGCEVGFHDPNESVKFPLPGDKVYHRTVIASVYYNDDIATLLVMECQPPYFAVAQLDLEPHGNLTIVSEHFNIVPAVRDYEQWGGDY